MFDDQRLLPNGFLKLIEAHLEFIGERQGFGEIPAE